jgi:hypothetical protein
VNIYGIESKGDRRYRIEKATGEDKIWNRKQKRQERRYGIGKATGRRKKYSKGDRRGDIE